MNLSPTGMDSNGQFRIGGINDSLLTGPIIGNTTTPSVAIQTAAGTGASASVVGTNVAGKITFITGTLSLGIGMVLRLTLGGGFSFPNGCFVAFAAGNSNFASIGSSLYVQSGTNTLDLYVATLALGVSTTYIGHYLITGY